MAEKPSFFDIPYAIPSAILTSGVTVVATTAADYVGISVSASAAAVTVIVYDNSATASGSFLDVIPITATTGYRPDRTNIIRARKGITVDIQGAGGRATVFYTPKG